MATATVKLYNIKELKEDKNFVVDDIEDYLATKTLIKTITDFQYQRFDLYKKIKVNLSQNNQLNSDSVSRITYVKIETPYSNTENAIYYYFVEHINQISESTIELELKMDVLNTNKYTTSTVKNNTYKLSDRSLITREHKNRWSEEYLNLGDDAKLVMSPGLHPKIREPRLDTLIHIDKAAITQDTNLHTFIFGDNNIPPSESVLFNVHCYNLLDNSYYDFGYSMTPPIKFCCSSISFQYDGNDVVEIQVRFIEGNTARTIVDEIVLSEEEWFIEIKRFVSFTTNSYKNAFANMLYYIQGRYGSLNRIRLIDKFQEGIESITFKHSEEMLLETESTNDWYVCYSSQNAVVQSATDTEATYVNPVQVDFFSDNGYTISTSSASVVRIYPDAIPQYANVEEWLIVDLTQLEASGYVEINGTQYTSSGYTYAGNTYTQIAIEKKNNNDSTFRRIRPYPSAIDYMYENVRYIDFYGLNYCELYSGINDLTQSKLQDFYIGSGSSTITGTSPQFNSIDLTDPKLIKIIAFPYAPREDLLDIESSSLGSELVWNNTLKCVELQKAQINGFNRVIKFEHTPFKELVKDENQFLDLNYRTARDIKYESKLYHSDFYNPKFVYDSFAFSFRLEDMDVEQAKENISDAFNVGYVCSGNVQSKFMFQFPQYVCDREVQDYNDILIVERNNEKALFNNAYINYIRSGGFRFDTKNADTQKMVNGLMIALSTVGAIGSFVAAPYTGGASVKFGVGLAVAAATKTISAIHSAQQNDRQISQKLLSASQQSTSVSTSEDIDILKAYSNNKAKLCYYEVSSYLKDALWDLFHYFGYKCQYYGIPNVSTRCNFNFVQGEVILKEYTFNEDIANEITNKWKEGITFIHHNTSGWDMEQEYENFETNLLS